MQPPAAVLCSSCAEQHSRPCPRGFPRGSSARWIAGEEKGGGEGERLITALVPVIRAVQLTFRRAPPARSEMKVAASGASGPLLPDSRFHRIYSAAAAGGLPGKGPAGSADGAG